MGTLHFRYLLEESGGLLIAATSFDQHLEQLARSLADASTERRPFIQAFVRPLGLNVAATPRFVDEVESLQSVSVTAPPRPRFEWLARRWLGTAIGYRDDVSREHWVYSDREREKIVRVRAHEESKAERARERKLVGQAIKDRRRADKRLKGIS
jgi:hypothetical protein